MGAGVSVGRAVAVAVGVTGVGLKAGGCVVDSATAVGVSAGATGVFTAVGVPAGAPGVSVASGDPAGVAEGVASAFAAAGVWAGAKGVVTVGGVSTAAVGVLVAVEASVGAAVESVAAPPQPVANANNSATKSGVTTQLPAMRRKALPNGLWPLGDSGSRVWPSGSNINGLAC